MRIQESDPGEFSTHLLCEVVDLSPSSFYYRSVPVDDQELRATLHEVAAEFPRYGSRRLVAQLRRRGHVVNRKRMVPLMREEGITIKTKRRRGTTDSRPGHPRYPNLVKELLAEDEVVRPDQVWCADITYIPLRRDFVYLAVLMDLHTRSIRGWELAGHMTDELTLSALRRALTTRSAPEIHHSDQGVQYASRDYVELLHSRQTRVSMTAVGRPTENGHVERFMRTLKEEEVSLHEYEDFHDAYARIGEFLVDVYTRKRIHSALGYLTPEEFETQCLASPPVMAEAAASW